jgi:hypothetical protein
MNAFSKDLIESLTEAVVHAQGKRTGVRVHVVKVPERSPAKNPAEVAKARRAGKPSARGRDPRGGAFRQ